MPDCPHEFSMIYLFSVFKKTGGRVKNEKGELCVLCGLKKEEKS